MPARNALKEYIPGAYYHVYNRGVDKRTIFESNKDYVVFLSILKRYLCGESATDNQRHQYDDLSRQINLLAFCLMPNHFHLLVFQEAEYGLPNLMRRVSTAYAMYFKKKHKTHSGHVFQDRYKASCIDTEPYLWHISRYIHLNPIDIHLDPQKYEYSSLHYYLSNNSPVWLNSKQILDIHQAHHTSYRDFVNDYKDYKASLTRIKSELADA